MVQGIASASSWRVRRPRSAMLFDRTFALARLDASLSSLSHLLPPRNGRRALPPCATRSKMPRRLALPPYLFLHSIGWARQRMTTTISCGGHPCPARGVFIIQGASIAFDWRAVTVADDAPPVHHDSRSQSVPASLVRLVLGACGQSQCSARWLIHSKSTTYSGIDFSVQYFVNCVNISSRGCGGGSSYQAFAHAYNYGAVDSSCLPYSAVTQQCTPHDTCQQNLHDTSKHPTINTAKPIRYYVSEYGQVGTDGMEPQQKEEAMLKELYARGPIASCMACPDDFEDNYKGGILAVNTSRSVCDHIVAIVGFGGEGDKAYWIVQNSFGSVWGEQGYFEIKRSSALQEGEHNLGIEKRVSWAMPA